MDFVNTLRPAQRGTRCVAELSTRNHIFLFNSCISSLKFWDWGRTIRKARGIKPDFSNTVLFQANSLRKWGLTTTVLLQVSPVPDPKAPSLLVLLSKPASPQEQAEVPLLKICKKMLLVIFSIIVVNQEGSAWILKQCSCPILCIFNFYELRPYSVLKPLFNFTRVVLFVLSWAFYCTDSSHFPF